MKKNMFGEYRVMGPPGTGKTTYLSRQIERAVDKFGANEVLVASFTKAAATELISRDIAVPFGSVGTLHALCYRALGQPEIAEMHIQEFNSQYPHFKLSAGKASVDEAAHEASYDTEADELFNRYNLLRAQLYPIHEDNIPVKLKAFIKAWTSFKMANNYIDFTDMIEIMANTKGGPPDGQKIGFYDECQDFNKLSMKLVRRWSEHQTFTILVGDDDQCSIEGTNVLTTCGYKKIEDLDPEIDRLASYDQNKSYVSGISNRKITSNQYKQGKSGYGFEIKKEAYKGEVITVTAGEKSTTTTPIHKWPVKWTDNARGKEVVYMMNKKNLFRIGRATLIRSDGCFNLGVRCRNEKAECAWILKVCDTKEEAALYEAYYSYTYGIPQMLFRSVSQYSPGYSDIFSQKQIDKFWMMMDKNTMLQGALTCLRDCALEISRPFWINGKSNKFGSKIFNVDSCNLFDNIMAVAVHDGGNNVIWQPVTIRSRPYKGNIYSLNVDTHHKYIADGLVTHNCIYAFSGANPDAFLGKEIPASSKQVLSQSWRIPRRVHDTAVRWIEQIKNREQKQYMPRDAEGEVINMRNATIKAPQHAIDLAMKYVDQGKTVMFLTTCGYMLNAIKTHLRTNALPYHNPYRRTRGDWNPLGNSTDNRIATKDRLLSFLNVAKNRQGIPLWTREDLSRWLELVSAKGNIVSGGKKTLQGICESQDPIDSVDLNDIIKECFEPAAYERAMNRDINWLLDNAVASKKSALEFPASIVRKHGAGKLGETPKIIISTIHGVKGGEADVCFVFPDLSRQGLIEYQKGGKDSIIRTFYVGMTRAKETLVLCSPSTGMCVKF